MSRVVGTFESVAGELIAKGGNAAWHGKGAVAPVMDRAAAEARNHARMQWRTGSGRSAASIVARMGRGRNNLTGYLIMDGEGGFFQEVGAGNRPPNPVLGPTMERWSGAAAEAVGDAGARL